MKNRLMSLTVAGVLAAPAFAAAPQADWSLYGTLVSEIYNAKTTGATVTPATNDMAGRTKFTCATSNLGFKGSMKVADDVKVIWQIETAINQDGDYPGPAGSAGGIGTRNTALGLTGSWGTFMAGQWDTPYKADRMPVGHIRASVESDMTIIQQPGFNTMGTTTVGAPSTAAKNAAFNRRQGNSIQYWSPEVIGLQAKLMYSINEAKTENAAAAAQVNPSLFSGTLTYKNKPLGLTVTYGYEQHSDYYGLAVTNGVAGTTITAAAAGTSSKDTGHELIVLYVAPFKTRFTAIVEQLKYTTSGQTTTTNVSEYKRNAWWLSAAHTFADHYKVILGGGSADKGDVKYVNGGSPTTGNEFGAKQYQLAVSYVFNKNAEIFAFYGGIKNDKNAQYNLMPFASATNTVAQGADTRTIGLGMFYSF